MEENKPVVAYIKPVVREAVEELWGKMVDMQRGNQQLSEEEWEEVLRILDKRVFVLQGVVED